MKKIISLILISMFLLSASVYANPFNDIEGHWAESEILNAYDAMIVDGDGDGTFRPDDNISRAEFVKLLASVISLNYLEPIPDGLAETDHWASKYYVFAKSLVYKPLSAKVGDVTPGILNDSDIDAPIERWEMAFMAGEAFKNLFYITDTSSYADEATVTENYPTEVAEAIGVCVNVGIIRGDENGYFNPSDNGTRAEATAIINRMDLKIQNIVK